MRKCNGYLEFYYHLAIEIVTFYILGHYLNLAESIYCDLVYDFLAFVPQILIGYAYDNKMIRKLVPMGAIFSSLALITLGFDFSPYIVITLISVASCFVHVGCAENTLRRSKGLMSPSAIFVSGGSFGLIIGKILAIYNVHILVVFVINLTLLLSLLFHTKYADNDSNLEKYKYANTNINKYVLIVIVTFVVAIRAFMGYGIPSSWNKTLIETVLLYVFMGTGKALGGISIDKLGIKKTIYISTLGALPFLVFGDNLMILSLVGVMLFSMTMAITLAILVSALKEKPGVAFGFTTIGLFLGTFPMFCFKIHSLSVNICVVIVFTIISLSLLLKGISDKGEVKYD